MRKTRLKSVVSPDGTRIFCVHPDEVHGVRAQAQGYLAHGIEIRVGDVVFDVGANIGLFALEAARAGATVHAFEPMPATFAALRANSKRFGRSRAASPESSNESSKRCEPPGGEIRARRLALGGRAELATFTYFHFLSALSTRFPAQVIQNGRAGIESILDNALLTPRAGWFRRAPQKLRRAVLAAFTPLLFASRTETCPVETLSAQLKRTGAARIDLLKIDVEGAEMEVLEGIEAHDWPKIKQVVAEIHDENGRLNAIHALLTRHGLSEIWSEKEPDAGQFEIYLLWARRPNTNSSNDSH